jgi:hypothetical protein
MRVVRICSTREVDHNGSFVIDDIASRHLKVKDENERNEEQAG